MQLAKKPFRPNLISVVLIAGLIAFVAYLVFFVNIAEVTNILAATNLTIYSFAFVTYILYTMCSSLTWHSLLNDLSVKISLRKAILYTWVGLFFDATVPQLGWSAEISKTYFLSKDSKEETGRIGASVVGQKIITMTIVIIALTAGLTLLLVNYSFPLFSTLLIGLVLATSIVFLALVFYVSFKPAATKTLLNAAIKIVLIFRKQWDAQGFRAKGEHMLGSFHESIKQLRANPKVLIKPIIFAVLGFVFEVSVMFLAFAALGEPLPVDAVLIVFTLTGTLQTIGVAFFGFPELIMTLALTALSIDPSVAVSVALLTRIVNLWFRLVISYVALQWAGIKIIRKTSQD